MFNYIQSQLIPTLQFGAAIIGLVAAVFLFLEWKLSFTDGPFYSWGVIYNYEPPTPEEKDSAERERRRLDKHIARHKRRPILVGLGYFLLAISLLLQVITTWPGWTKG